MIGKQDFLRHQLSTSQGLWARYYFDIELPLCKAFSSQTNLTDHHKLDVAREVWGLYVPVTRYDDILSEKTDNIYDYSSLISIPLGGNYYK